MFQPNQIHPHDEPKRTSPFRALRHRNFRLFLAGMAVSLAGTWMQQLAQSWLVYRLTHSAWMLGLTWFCANLPVLVLAPVAGVVADRFPRRGIVIVAQTCAMLQAFVLAALTLSGRVQIHHVLGMALVLGVCTAFDVAARQSLYIHLVGKEDLLSAISLNSATFNSARVVGPALGGLVVAHLGEGLCFLLNGFSFLAVLAALAAMHLNEPRYAGTENPFARLRGGFRLAAGSPPLRTAFLLIGAMTLAVAPVTALGPLFADGFFHRGAQGLGWLTGALGLGAIAGTLTLASSRGGTLLPHAVMQALCVAGAALLIFAASPSYWLCLAVMPVLGMCIFRSNAATNTMLQMRVPEGFRGRIMGLYSATVIGMLPIGSLLAGALAAHIGPRWTVACGSLLALAGALYAARHRHRMRSWLEESPAASVTPGPAGLL